MFKYLVIVQEQDDSDPIIVGFGETEEQAERERALYVDYYEAKVYKAIEVELP